MAKNSLSMLRAVTLAGVWSEAGRGRAKLWYMAQNKKNAESTANTTSHARGMLPDVPMNVAFVPDFSLWSMWNSRYAGLSQLADVNSKRAGNLFCSSEMLWSPSLKVKLRTTVSPSAGCLLSLTPATMALSMDATVCRGVSPNVSRTHAVKRVPSPSNSDPSHPPGLFSAEGVLTPLAV